MFEAFNTVRTLYSQATPLLTQYLGSEAVAQLQQEIDQRTQNQQPVVMVYGVYNAGKSTLINALLGQEQAMMGDIPQTDRVDAYQVGDVTILDTPGIDAPIEHEQITREQLAKADAVIFVLNSDGVLEEQQTYEEIGRILRDGKPLLVVINNKTSLKATDTSYMAMMDKFRANMAQYFAQDAEVQSRLAEVESFLINAKVALKGRLEHKPQLVEYSQILPLEKAVARLFKRTNSAQIAKTLAVQIQHLVQQAITAAKQGEQQAELVQLNKFIESLQNSQQQLNNKVLSFALKRKASLHQDLVAGVTAGQSQEALQPLFDDLQQAVSGYLEEQLARELKILDVEAQATAALFMHKTGVSGLPSAQAIDNESGLGMTELLDVLTKSGVPLKLGEDFAKQGIVMLLKQGKSWFPKLFHGIGPVTMGKWATRSVPVIGTLLNVGMAFYDYWSAKNAEEKQIEAQRQHRQAINREVGRLVEELYEQLTDAVEDALASIFAPIIQQLQQSLASLSQQAKTVDADIGALNSLELKLAAF